MKNKILLLFLLLMLVLLNACTKTDIINDNTLKIEHYRNINIPKTEKDTVDEFDIDEYMSSKLFDEKEGLTNEWVKKQNIKDVSTVKEYNAYVKNILEDEAETNYQLKLDEAVWKALKPHCKWVKKPNKEIIDYAIQMNDGNKIDSYIYLDDAEDMIMHKKAIELIAKNEGIKIDKYDIDKTRDLLIEQETFDTKYSLDFSEDEIKYITLLKWVNHFIKKRV